MCFRQIASKYKPTRRFWVSPFRKHFRLWTCVQLWRGVWASPMEALFWQEANRPWWNKPLPNLRRQYPLLGYRVDFALPHLRIVIEIDGAKWHSTLEQKRKDAERQKAIEEMGWKVFRFTGSDVNNLPRSCVLEVKRRLR